jgi:RNA polymerase sigma-70 factor (ECF subfamily)
VIRRRATTPAHAEPEAKPNLEVRRTPLDEQAAIGRVLHGEENAFDELIQQYQGLAYSVAYRTLQDEAAAGDAVQDSFIKAYRALSQFHGGSFKSWLMRIVVNTCYDVMRSNQWRKTESLNDLTVEDDHAAPLIDHSEGPQEYVERAELNQWIESGIRTLSADQRLVLVLCDVHGYAYEEIAEITGQPMGTVKSRISRARAHLRDYLVRRPELLPTAFRPK